MKKTVKKLSLSRETLHHLADASLQDVAGGDFTATCKTWCWSCQKDCPLPPNVN